MKKNTRDAARVCLNYLRRTYMAKTLRINSNAIDRKWSLVRLWVVIVTYVRV
jgi:hypothetical protein